MMTVPFSTSLYGGTKARQKTGGGERSFSVEIHHTVQDRVKDRVQREGPINAAGTHAGPDLIDVSSQELQRIAVPVSPCMGYPLFSTTPHLWSLG